MILFFLQLAVSLQSKKFAKADDFLTSADILLKALGGNTTAPTCGGTRLNTSSQEYGKKFSNRYQKFPLSTHFKRSVLLEKLANSKGKLRKQLKKNRAGHFYTSQRQRVKHKKILKKLSKSIGKLIAYLLMPDLNIFWYTNYENIKI